MISPNEKTNESILNTNVNENINPTVVDVNQIKTMQKILLQLHQMSI